MLAAMFAAPVATDESDVVLALRALREEFAQLPAALVRAQVEAQGQETAQIAGLYLCAGKGPKGSYAYAVEIVQVGRVVGVRWNDRNGGAYSGYGLIVDGIVSVAFVAADGFVGLIVYRIRDGALYGEWPDPSGRDVWTETLTKAKPVTA